jgi:phosphoribosylamine--glycine ligase
LRILVVGSGGREHALCWKLAQSSQEVELYCAPGNIGIGRLADLVPVAPEEIQQLADFASELRIDLTVVGPELPLALGIVDELTSRGLQVFGPSRDAAQLESSKVFAKEFMARHGIATAPFEVAHDADEVRRAVTRLGLPLVLKADGLAAGKGVLIVEDEAAVESALAVFFTERRFGASGNRVVVEPFLVGEEVSFMALADGEHVLPLATSKDYKRIGDGDSGPNTGGMGAHTPSGVLSAEEATSILDRIVRPTVAAMAEEQRPFVGVLYAGLMLTADGPQVLEFNVRFGDPEAQAVLLRMEDDLAELLLAASSGGLGAHRPHFRKGAAACLVMAAEGYPGAPKKGAVIGGLEEAEREEGVAVFHAGTAERDGQIVVAGGRVLNVCALGEDLREALRRAYDAAARIDWPGRVLRTDIGRRVLERLSQR